MIAFPKSAIKEDIDGTGFIVSRNSDFRITACTWTHKKWPESTPDGKILLRAYVGKPGDQGVVDLSDEEIINIALNDLNKTMNITGKPEFSIVSLEESYAAVQYRALGNDGAGEKFSYERASRSLFSRRII